MHKRQEIIQNQRLYQHEIIKWLKDDFKSTKKDLDNIKPSKDDMEIQEAQKKLIAKAKKVKMDREIEKLFINDKNAYPKFYAWWDDESQETIIYKYEAR